jgi:DNA replication protein DnaC
LTPITFLANALGHVATRHGYNVIFTRADAMLRRLKQSRLDNSRESIIAELTSVDLLIVDDFALEPMSRDESRDIYQLVVERNGRAPTVITIDQGQSSNTSELFDHANAGLYWG